MTLETPSERSQKKSPYQHLHLFFNSIMWKVVTIETIMNYSKGIKENLLIAVVGNEAAPSDQSEFRIQQCCGGMHI